METATEAQLEVTVKSHTAGRQSLDKRSHQKLQQVLVVPNRPYWAALAPLL